jgi:hypothetical protein
MDVLDTVSKLWPIGVAVVMVIVLFAKMDVRLKMMEEKVKTLFELYNKD